MRSGPLVTALVAGGAMVTMIFAFSANASPYVGVKEARASTDDRLHLAGQLVPGSMRNELKSRALRFKLKDVNGDVISIEHVGERPSSLTQATRIVAVGGVKNGVFHSRKLIVKCPSKYEEESGPVASR